MQGVSRIELLLPSLLLLLAACDPPFLGARVRTPQPAPVGPVSLAAPLSTCASSDICEDHCDAGVADACARAARFYRDGIGRERDHTRAAELQLLACTGFSARGCLELSRSYQLGRGVPRDTEQALTRLRQACSLESAEACGDLGVVHLDAGNAELARLLFFRACLGNACREWGWALYSGGAGLEQNRAAALEVWRGACGSGDQPADAGSCLELALLRADGGPAVPQDAVEARALAERSCSSGELRGCEVLGKLLHQGAGGEADPERANRLFDQACSAGFGSAIACGELQQPEKAATKSETAEVTESSAEQALPAAE